MVANLWQQNIKKKTFLSDSTSWVILEIFDRGEERRRGDDTFNISYR